MSLESLPAISARDFGVRIAKAFLDVGSSNVWFFLQQAYKDVGGLEELDWNDIVELLNRVVSESGVDNGR
jgi:hypothetical protein